MRRDHSLRLIAALTILIGIGGVWNSIAWSAECVINVTVDYLDPDNDVNLELYMETQEKFSSLPPSAATDPIRIRQDAADLNVPLVSRTLVIQTGIVLPKPSGIPRFQIPCSDISDPAAVLLDTPYVILGVYTDGVVEPGTNPPVQRLYGAVSPGIFMFSIGDIELGLVIDSDPVPGTPGGPAVELLDVSWAASSFLPGSSVTLYFDRDNRLDILASDGTYLRTIVANDINNASVVLVSGERIFNNGVEGLDYGPINLAVDPRFPPPPPTGRINPTQYPNGVFRWDFSELPAGQLFVYGILENRDGKLVLDYAPGSSTATETRWPVYIGAAVDDRFVQGVAIHDIVASASELDVVGVAQSGLFRVYDYLGRAWGSYSIDLEVTIDTAPACADVDNDGETEIVLGTDQLKSDENPIFSKQNAILVIDSSFKSRYDALKTAVKSSFNPTQAVIEGLISQYQLTHSIHFIPAGQGVFHTPAIRDIDGDGKKEVIVVTRPLKTGGDSVVRVISFGNAINTPPIVEAEIVPPVGTGYLGSPSVGNLDGDKSDLEVCIGSASGKIYVFDPDNGSLGNPVLSVNGPTLRSPALMDTDNDTVEEILMAISERDRTNPVRTELHYFEPNGAPVAPFAKTRIFRPALAYDSLSTPVVTRLFPAGSVPAGFTNDLCALFTTRNTFTGISLNQTDPATGEGLPVFNLAPSGVDFYFGSSSPIVGQYDPLHASFEIILGGGRDSHGNLFGWYFSPSTANQGFLTSSVDFANHQEPRLDGQFYATSILGSPEMADLDGNGLTDVLYTSEGGFINRLESSQKFTNHFLPADFPWPSFKHDSARTGSVSAIVAPIRPFVPGDVNRDGVVDENDLFSVSKSWGKPVRLDLRGGALDPKSPADDFTSMTPQGFLLRVIADMHR
jgi:hypothetical protein